MQRHAWRVVSYLSPIGCRIVNWVTTANGRVHTADTTQLDRINSQHVQFPNFRRQLWASCEFNTHRRRRRDSTRDWRIKLETGSRLTTGAFTPPTRRNSTSFSRCLQIVQTRRDCRQLVANSIHTADATQLRLNSAVDSRRRRRCVLGLK